jgi:hypothetical protein
MPKIGVVVEKDGKLKTEYANIPDSHYRLVQRYGMTFRGEVYGGDIGAIFGKCAGEKDKDEVIEDFVNQVRPKEGTAPIDALCNAIRVLACRKSGKDIDTIMKEILTI